MVKIKRVYEPEARGDGYRVLIDRLWPRGLKKTELQYDEWPKEICPSSDIRKFFAHDPSKFKEFKQLYKKELKDAVAKEKIKELAKRAGRQNVTLLYAAHDEHLNQAVILKEEIERHLKTASHHKRPADSNKYTDRTMSAI
ncbi:MAG: DUF488 domain-containing protein [Bdellovibrio sp.]